MTKNMMKAFLLSMISAQAIAATTMHCKTKVGGELYAVVYTPDGSVTEMMGNVSYTAPNGEVTDYPEAQAIKDVDYVEDENNNLVHLNITDGQGNVLFSIDAKNEEGGPGLVLPGGQVPEISTCVISE
ncbi:MAG: hypothetical protein AAF203_02985 [Pseudomonadota bacterium]